MDANYRDYLPFDFANYLFSLTQSHWTAQELSGGNANHVVRAVQTRPRPPANPVIPNHGLPAAATGDDSDNGQASNIARRILTYRTIVLKQAPPYFAKFPDFAFSQRRQFVEAQALRLFRADRHLSDVLTRNPSIDVPLLLHHDEAQHVLIQSDLGSHMTLDKFLACPSTTAESAAVAGRHLGQFLADLHHAYDSDSNALAPGSDLHASLANEDAETVMQGVIANATRFMKAAGVSDYEELGERALQHWMGRKKTAFSQGDIWFGTIMVDPSAGWDSDAPALKICDWEFAGPNEPAADIAQLGAYLHLSSLSSLRTTPSLPVLDVFSSSLYTLYSTSSPPFRTVHEMREFQRSVLIMHGWELVNAAAWRHGLWCDCPGAEVKCEHIKAMIWEGVKLLRAVGQPDDEMEEMLGENVHWFSAFWRSMDDRLVSLG
ncbi:hypothetical protein EVG20_g2535 [Dentipellis fragilis]|uniref:Aminoglycoside phosphotransferase domain-containing protein n=1 Tax=Dentipellis fragilis TaxID=205917 RepID=A0A4Y9Z9H1_9AGAM|nr:hypothetical protein EVG20_g2535 [Dentipellis fragilis]